MVDEKIGCYHLSMWVELLNDVNDCLSESDAWTNFEQIDLFVSSTDMLHIPPVALPSFSRVGFLRRHQLKINTIIT